MSLLFVVTLVANMMPNLGITNGVQTDGFNYRIPPMWSPENEAYSILAYVTYLTLWVMITYLHSHQQAGAIIMRLRASARELGVTITPQEIMNGGIINGVALGPVSYIITGLHNRLALLNEEARLSAMTDMLAFARRPHETISSRLSRYEVVRQRAAAEGQFVMSMEGCSLHTL